MIRVQVGGLSEAPVGAVVRPVTTDFSAVTPTMRRFDAAAGPAVAEQCQRVGELPLGSAVITAGGALPADFIVHVAVRSPTENPTSAVVRQGLLNALRRLADWDVATVAVAPLGTGAGNLDAEEAADAMLPVILEHIGRVGVPADVTIIVDDEYQRVAFATALSQHRDDGAGTGS